MISELIRQAEEGRPIWLPDLRQSFASLPSSLPVRIRLSGGAYGTRDFSLSFPTAGNEEEREFLLRYCCASVYNLLSAYSAEEVALYADGPAAELLQAVPARFEKESGFRKVMNIAGRIYGALHFRIESLDSYRPAPLSSAAPSVDLQERLLAMIRQSEEKGCVGVDVGGSDIKLAVSCRGKLLYTEEYDWNPAASPTAEGILDPILALVKTAKERIEQSGGSLDAVGISFPDVVIGDRILGGETPKTKGMRENASLDYEREFSKLGALRDQILPLCAPGASVRITNDGNMAAFTAAVELAAGESGDAIRRGVIAHSLGTDLGTGWLKADGTIPAIPLELYDLLLDLGSLPAAALPPEDLRSTRNENSGMNGLRRYLGQAAAWRLAYRIDPRLIEGFLTREDGRLCIPTAPEDLRKPCLQHLMDRAAQGDPKAEEIFRTIGKNLSVVTREANWLFSVTPPRRILFGRFVKSRRCFELLREGFSRGGTGVELMAADEELANSALMKQLTQMPGVTVAQFAQAIGAIYYALS